MTHYVMVGEGVYPIVPIKDYESDHLERDSWMNGDIINFKVPEPIRYELEGDVDNELDDSIPGPKILYDELPIPVMHISLLDALKFAGVTNLQTYDAVLRDSTNGIEYKDYKAFNVVGKVAAADMEESTMMSASNSVMIDADFNRLVFSETKCKGKLLFRLAENITAIIVDERVKYEIEKRSIKGIFFYASWQWAG